MSGPAPAASDRPRCVLSGCARSVSGCLAARCSSERWSEARARGRASVSAVDAVARATALDLWEQPAGSLRRASRSQASSLRRPLPKLHTEHTRSIMRHAPLFSISLHLSLISSSRRSAAPHPPRPDNCSKNLRLRAPCVARFFRRLGGCGRSAIRTDPECAWMMLVTMATDCRVHEYAVEWENRPPRWSRSLALSQCVCFSHLSSPFTDPARTLFFPGF